MQSKQEQSAAAAYISLAGSIYHLNDNACSKRYIYAKVQVYKYILSPAKNIKQPFTVVDSLNHYWTFPLSNHPDPWGMR